ncbi:glycosyl hydrolase, putative [Talaromyces stipitatus ATCC 10500]|uniref:Glycosyl hydrolase, putative n=1 Tax=Talaromyces stipitatus (strain ATCC 10500 / CBS 375.48 / QM 6759 / NRRL 1006) TaxID=441959 RepID=B8MED4_TALSN|nr:glycosyl hydrolase, putative [Talaromyces stipitatus ATCC 10500]EED16561.1 glycosyl hydrolase, putative [Talaromyces stipitatus ATCC 10500]
MMTIFFAVVQPLFALFLGRSLALPDLRQAILSTDDANQAVTASSTQRQTLKDMLYALDVMQDSYFEQWLGTWPDAIDWTAAVIGTHISGTLSSLTMTSPDSVLEQTLAYENLINRYFDQVSNFYFGENAFAVRMQAFDDMLWVVLGWLESIKFQNLHSELHYETVNSTIEAQWHGKQLRVPAAHRARVFYELASSGWDSELCEGGMIWSPYLEPYKNAITNELFISASIGMYLYFTGDPIGSPFVSSDHYRVHDPSYLAAAVRSYQWLKDSNMTGTGGLYADGFHIHGYKGIKNPGTKKCDVLNPMVFTYNQGVILSGLRGLWLATSYQDYLQDGHELIERVMRATGWPRTNRRNWSGLGRGGVLEEACDSHSSCSQDGHTFKGIFFHHLTEFCHVLRPEEVRLLALFAEPSESIEEKQDLFDKWHLARCRKYGDWIEHNARAALATRNEQGKFGMWWGVTFPSAEADMEVPMSSIPPGAIDYVNHGEAGRDSDRLKGLLRTLSGDDYSEYSNNSTIPSKMGKPLSRAEQAAGQYQSHRWVRDVNDRGRGRTVETQSGGLAVLRAWYQWQTSLFLQ